MSQFKDLDSLLHSQLRLAIVSILMTVEAAEFSYLKEKTGATSGNLSVQITKLKEGGYIDVSKYFRDNYPQTLCSITELGREKFHEYVKALEIYLNPGKQ